jgi:FAD:protein FMN transferase
MGGRSRITLVGSNDGLMDAAFALADRCESLWSRFLEQSDVTRLNWAEGKPTDVDPLTVRLIRAMLEGFAATDGDYDPTLLPDVVSAGYAASQVDPSKVTRLPGSARAPGNPRGIVLEDSTVWLPRGTTIDPGGIGKGLVADLVCEFAMSQGAFGVMAEIGGDIVVAGQAPDGDAWRLGIEDPFDTDQHVMIMRLARGSLVTSSQRKKRFSTPDGESHHLVNPRTSASAVTNIQTVSVIAATGAKAETLTKPGFIRDPDDYLAWLPTVGAAALLIDDTGATLQSHNWERYL